jgi:hypothetical protein
VLQDKKDHGISKKDQRLEVVKGKWVPSQSASALFKPSRYSVRHRAESQVSALDQIIKDVPPEGGGTGAVAAGETVGVVTNGWPARFDDPSLEDFLQNVIPSVWESAYSSKQKIISYLGTITLFRGGLRVFFTGWVAPSVDVPVPVA